MTLEKVKLDGNLKSDYDEEPCGIDIKSVAANITKGHHLKRNVNLPIMSMGLSDLIWKVLATTMNLTNGKEQTIKLFC